MPPVTRSRGGKPPKLSTKALEVEGKLPDPVGPQKWTDEEVETLVIAIMEKGHLDFDAILEKLPNRTQEEYKTFLRKSREFAVSRNYRQADEYQVKVCKLVNICKELNKKRGAFDGREIALVLKALSVDGLVENHPLPEEAGGVDYGQLYRILYQAVMGHPLQPVNLPTLDLLYEAIKIIENAGKCRKCEADCVLTEAADYFSRDPSQSLNEINEPEMEETPEPEEPSTIVKVRTLTDPDSCALDFGGVVKLLQVPKKGPPPADRSAIAAGLSPAYNPLGCPPEWWIDSLWVDKLGCRNSHGLPTSSGFSSRTNVYNVDIPDKCIELK